MGSLLAAIAFGGCVRWCMLRPGSTAYACSSASGSAYSPCRQHIDIRHRVSRGLLCCSTLRRINVLMVANRFESRGPCEYDTALLKRFGYRAEVLRAGLMTWIRVWLAAPVADWPHAGERLRQPSLDRPRARQPLAHDHSSALLHFRCEQVSARWQSSLDQASVCSPTACVNQRHASRRYSCTMLATLQLS